MEQTHSATSTLVQFISVTVYLDIPSMFSRQTFMSDPLPPMPVVFGFAAYFRSALNVGKGTTAT